MRPFVLQSLDQFLPDPPPSLQSLEWVDAFNQIKIYGPLNGSARTDEQTFIARFWAAHVVRQYNRVARDIADLRGLGLLETARLAAMINVISADSLMSTFNAKYHYLFWRPVTVIDPTAVTNDGFGPVPGYDDGNPATVEQTGWRPLMITPNHPEYPSAHGAITSAVAEVLTTFLGTNQIDLDIHGFDPAGPPGNLNAVRHFDMANDLRHEIIDARLWAGFHYRFSTVTGVVLGRRVANFDLSHAFRPSSSTPSTGVPRRGVRSFRPSAGPENFGNKFPGDAAVYIAQFLRAQRQGPLAGLDGAGDINTNLALGAGLVDSCAGCQQKFCRGFYRSSTYFPP
jgi:VCPO second helical-bundle domain